MEYSRIAANRPFRSLLSLEELSAAYMARLRDRSRLIVNFFDLRMEAMISSWIVVTLLVACAKIASSPLPVKGAAEAAAMTLPYLLVALAPIAGYRIAAGSFPRGTLSAQPVFRLCRYGSWQKLDELEARQSPSFGPAGFMASLLLGMLLNVPVRSLEFFAAVPALGGDAPVWAKHILLAMTIDVIVMNFLYMVCFVMALRSIPLFPRMLLFAWSADIALQITMAHQLGVGTALPANVATAMAHLLHGNIEKVLISVAVWLPYLVLSERVNVTFRRRASA